ncbi:fungal-specific transcription factor domain-containing protein [Pyrenochaeta sp. MPI-SDFR-AT-0127]|nr:fungal-specific transcription factor domain-containing protein [Pyrenochaeta sp. MPI-SDFR-AT-0127]
MPTPKSQERRSGAPRTRAACSYCQLKKIKCDGARPSCLSCRTHNRECVQRVPVPLARPTNRRIQQLEEENRRLRELTRHMQQDEEQSIAANEQVLQDVNQTTQQMVYIANEAGTGGGHSQTLDDQVILPNSVQLPLPDPCQLNLPLLMAGNSTETSRTSDQSAESPDTGRPSYHGPTSAFFKEAPHSEPGVHSSTITSHTTSQAPTTKWRRDHLVAQSSKQRQVETLNLTTKLLDFDGLEPKLGMELIALYWSRQLHTGMIVYRPIFMRDMACKGPFFSKLLLNAMYYSVSKHSPCTSIRKDPLDKSTAGWSFRERFSSLLRDMYDRSRITTIQALLIMASSLFTRCDEKSASWLYAGLAFNMIIDLGIHDVSSMPEDTAEEELETRRRVFWAAYMIDKTQCLYQGRHPCLRLADTNMPLQFMDDYEEFEPFSTVSFHPTRTPSALPSYSISILKNLCKLCMIMEQIQTRLYAIGKTHKFHGQLVNEAIALETDLTIWRNGLPSYLELADTHQNSGLLPYQLSMLSLYYVLVILVNRLLLSAHLSHQSASTQNHTVDEALATCMMAASKITEILQKYESLYIASSATFSLSYATCVSAKFHVNVLAKHGNRFGTLSSLRTCMNALDDHQTIYSASRRARNAILSLIARMDIQVGEGEDQCDGRSRYPRAALDSPQNENSYIVGNDATIYSGNVLASERPGETIQNSNFLDGDPSVQFDEAMLQFRNHPEMLESWHDTVHDLNFDDLYQSTTLTEHAF